MLIDANFGTTIIIKKKLIAFMTSFLTMGGFIVYEAQNLHI